MLLLGIGQSRPCVKSQNAGHFGKTLVRRHRRRIVDWSPPVGVAHDNLHLATGELPGVNGCWRGEPPRCKRGILLIRLLRGTRVA
ncbi:MAG: hypothetical protein CMJ64_18470 [Planctomycetaceae bacterium]|nr:hypothetical protein [Planctomycetaceae bacterium]